MADATLDALQAADIVSVDADGRRRGYATATWPGRLDSFDTVVGGHSLLETERRDPGGRSSPGRALEDLRPMLTGRK